MQCESSGIYKPPKTRKKPNLEGIDSRKCNCPFKLKGFFDKDTNDWWLAIFYGMHNHDLDEKLSGHLIAGRRSAEEKKKDRYDKELDDASEYSHQFEAK